MATTKLKSGVTCVWGATDASAPTTYGVVKSVSTRKSSKQSAFPDSDGETAAVTIYDETTEITMAVYCCTSVALPAIADSITAGTVTGSVLGVETAWESEGYKMVNITASKWKNITS